MRQNTHKKRNALRALHISERGRLLAVLPASTLVQHLNVFEMGWREEKGTELFIINTHRQIVLTLVRKHLVSFGMAEILDWGDVGRGRGGG